MGRTSVSKKEIAIVFADAHLQRRTWKQRPIFGDGYHSWKQIFDYALDHDISQLFGLGDLFDSRVNEPSPLDFAVEQFRRLQRGPKYLTLHYIQGQHELDEVRVLRLAEQLGVANHLHGKEVTLSNGMRVRGMDYQSADRIKEELAKIPAETDVLLSHQVWADFCGDAFLPQGEFADVPHVSQIWTGDLHQWILSSKYRGKEGQKLTVLSPGATHQTPGIDAPSDCYFAVVRDDGSIEQKKLKTRLFYKRYLQTNDQLEEFFAEIDAELTAAADYAEELRLPPDLCKPLWRVIYTSNLTDVERRIDRIVGDRVHMFYKEERSKETAETGKPILRPSGKALTLASCLKDEVDEAKEPAVFQLCQRLLDAGDSKDAVALELANWKKEVLSDAEAK